MRTSVVVYSLLSLSMVFLCVFLVLWWVFHGVLSSSEQERGGSFTLIVLWLSVSHCAMGWSAVCDCGNSY